jgi:lipopolysaccharide cholinephosphotransferase
MIKLEEGFLQAEEREGFFVEEMMKRVWAVELEVLSEIIRVCKKYGITYYADGGTLLGAVRHKGFIPWDDDIDIALKRADYQRLLAVLPDELPAEYYISSSYTPGEHNTPTSCVMNSRYINTDPEKIKRFYGTPYIAGVDLGPLDYVPRDPELAKVQTGLYSAVYDLAQNYKKYEQEKTAAHYLEQIEELCRVSIQRDGTEHRQLWQLADKIAGMFREDESDDLTWMPQVICYQPDYKFKKEWYQDVTEVPFENLMIAIPNGYHEILTTMYGDYMAPIRGEGSAHEYPFYRKQEEYLKKYRNDMRTKMRI